MGWDLSQLEGLEGGRAACPETGCLETKKLAQEPRLVAVCYGSLSLAVENCR